MSNINLSNEETSALRGSINKFINQHVSDNWRIWDEQKSIPKSLFRALGDAGYLGADLPEIYGGSDAGFTYAAEIIKAFCREGHLVHGGLQIAQQFMVAHMLNTPLVSRAIKERFLPLLISGEIVPALAITEPQGGSDILAMRCGAERVKDNYIINGTKTFISNANLADILIVVARTAPSSAKGKGLTAFLVDSKTPGVHIGKPLPKIGMHAADTAEIFLENVSVSSEMILGEQNMALSLLGAGMPRERSYVGICATAISQAALEHTKKYVTERILFGKPLSNKQNTRFELADLYADWQIFDAFMDQVISNMHRGQLTPSMAAVARLKGYETVMRIVDRCSLLFGGYGFMTEYPIAQLYTDVRGMAFWGGSNEVMKETIASQFLRG